MTIVTFARCPEHGLHGCRTTCFNCGGDVEQAEFVPLEEVCALADDATRQAAAKRVREYLRADPDRCQPTCRVGCPCDGGNQDAATGAPDAAKEIVDIVIEALNAR